MPLGDAFHDSLIDVGPAAVEVVALRVVEADHPPEKQAVDIMVSPMSFPATQRTSSIVRVEENPHLPWLNH